MADDRDLKLASIIVDHSLAIKPQEKVLITANNSASFPLVKAIYIEVLKRGAYPLLDAEIDTKVGRSEYNGFAYQFFSRANEWQLSHVPAEIIKAKIKWADAFVRVVSEDNLREFSQIDPSKLTSRAKLIRPLMDPMIDGNRWLLTYYPTPAMAQEAGVSLDWLIDFYYEACNVDYGIMKKGLMKLQKRMDEGGEIRVVGQMTDLTVNIKGRLAQACYGERNIPDGECFLAPVTDGVDGEVYFELPTLAYGHEVAGIHLEFKHGKVVTAKAERGDDALQKMLATDVGARYLGEFAIGANFSITRSMMNTLFDEKIGGTVHMALGRAYREKRGGGENESSIHWDIVKDMRLPGSVLTIDGKTILKDGRLLA